MSDLVFQPPGSVTSPQNIPLINTNREVEKLVQDQLATMKAQGRPFLTDLQNGQVQDFLASLRAAQQ